MGQSASSPRSPHFSASKSPSNPIPPATNPPLDAADRETPVVLSDFTSGLPDECLALIFQSLSAGDRKRCSLVCRRWLRVEGQCRHRISLNAQSELLSHIPSLFSRFDAVTKLALRCDRRSVSINDAALLSVSLRCPNLARLKLRACRQLSDAGVAAFAQNCKNLRKLSCGSCDFGSRGLNAIFEHCSSLEELSIKRLRGINDNGSEIQEPIHPGLGSKSLKSLCLKELYNGQLFAPIIAESKNLRTLKLIRCMGDWDRVLTSMADSNNGLVEIHLERLEVSDIGLGAISNCTNLEILHLVKTPECTNVGVSDVAANCKLLRKVHIDGWRTNRIGDVGLTALGKNCSNLQELVLIGINPTAASLEVIASNCRSLERLALCSSETIRDAEISCIAAKCVALKKFCVKSCPITDTGLEAFAWGCPNLVKVKIKKCREVTRCIIVWLKMRRESLVVNLDTDEFEPVEELEADVINGDVAQEEVLDNSHPTQGEDAPADEPVPLRGGGRHSLFRSKFGVLVGRNIGSCSLRRWSMGNNNGNGSSSSSNP